MVGKRIDCPIGRPTEIVDQYAEPRRRSPRRGSRNRQFPAEQMRMWSNLEDAKGVPGCPWAEALMSTPLLPTYGFGSAISIPMLHR